MAPSTAASTQAMISSQTIELMSRPGGGIMPPLPFGSMRAAFIHGFESTP